MRYFFRELGLDRPIVLGGKTYKFDYKKLEDGDALIPLLESCISKHIGGVIELTQEQYDEGVKKKTSKGFSLSRMPREEVRQRQIPSGHKGSAVRVEGEVGNFVTQTAEQVAVTRDFSAFMPKVEKGILS